MLKKYVDENTIRKVPKNGYIKVNGEEIGVSNLMTFLEENPEIAKENNYFEYIEKELPEVNENEYIETTYSIENDMIVPYYKVETYKENEEI